MRPNTRATATDGASVPGTTLERADQRSAARAASVVHPGTGELLPPLESCADDTLADALYALQDYEARAREWRKRIEAELRDRLLREQRAIMVAGGYEVRLKTRNESVWDADELETVVRDLIDRRIVDAAEVTDLIKHETTVSRTQANRLLDRLSGPAHAAVKRCRTWRKTSSSTLEVTPSVPLLPDQG